MNVTLSTPNGKRTKFRPAFNSPGTLGNFGLPRMDRDPAGAYAAIQQNATFVSGTSVGREWTSPIERRKRRETIGRHPPWQIGFETDADEIVTAEDPNVSFWELLTEQFWQTRSAPFLISFRPFGSDPLARRENAFLFARSLVDTFLGDFRTDFGILYQFGQGRKDRGSSDWLAEAIWEALELEALRARGIPVIGRFDPGVPVDVLRFLEPHCDGFRIADGEPWNDRKGAILRERDADWKYPQAVRYRLGEIERNGMVFGPKCLDRTIGKVGEARKAGILLPIIAGNGVRTSQDVRKLHEAGAQGIVADLGTILKSPEIDRVLTDA